VRRIGKGNVNLSNTDAYTKTLARLTPSIPSKKEEREKCDYGLSYPREELEVEPSAV